MDAELRICLLFLLLDENYNLQFVRIPVTPGMGQKRGLTWALGHLFTAANFEIAMIAALIGYVLFEFLRKIL